MPLRNSMVNFDGGWPSGSKCLTGSVAGAAGAVPWAWASCNVQLASSNNASRDRVSEECMNSPQ